MYSINIFFFFYASSRSKLEKKIELYVVLCVILSAIARNCFNVKKAKGKQVALRRLRREDGVNQFLHMQIIVFTTFERARREVRM